MKMTATMMHINKTEPWTCKYQIVFSHFSPEVKPISRRFLSSCPFFTSDRLWLALAGNFSLSSVRLIFLWWPRLSNRLETQFAVLINVLADEIFFRGRNRHRSSRMPFVPKLAASRTPKTNWLISQTYPNIRSIMLDNVEKRRYDVAKGHCMSLLILWRSEVSVGFKMPTRSLNYSFSILLEFFSLHGRF